LWVFWYYLCKNDALELINQQVLAYADKYSSHQEALLEELLETTLANHPKAHMISGRVQGLFLEMVSKMIKPERILEIGTFTGYSALCLAKGLSEQGRLHTIELREADAMTAQSYFDRSPYKEKITLHRGNALEIIPGIDESWDIVFIDADKTSYLEYYKMVMPGLRSGAVILADNVLFHGEVLNEPVSGKNAKAIQAFNEYIVNDDTADHVLLTVRDGIMMIRKK
jgi:caffeoyl-CoA O-methyltransferase